jgi:hypothetical protein
MYCRLHYERNSCTSRISHYDHVEIIGPLSKFEEHIRSNTTAELDHRLSRAHELRTTPYLNNMMAGSTFNRRRNRAIRSLLFKPGFPWHFFLEKKWNRNIQGWWLWNWRTRCHYTGSLADCALEMHVDLHISPKATHVGAAPCRYG